jgi:type I restriction-modification system DNA methylase subunit
VDVWIVKRKRPLLICDSIRENDGLIYTAVMGADGDGYFDIVIGNPPYVSAPTMVNTNIEGRKAITDSSRFSTLYQKWDLYIPFMELGLQLLTEKGIFTMIVPYPLTNQTYAKKLRELIIDQYNLMEVVDLNGTKVFKNATVSNCIPFISKTRSEQFCYISNMNEQKQILKVFRQNYSDLVQDEKKSIWNLTQEKRAGNRHSEMNVLGDFCYISVGMVLNADEKTARGKFTKDDLISETLDAVHCRKYIEAKDIERYLVKNVRYLEYNTRRCPDKLRRPTFRELYYPTKLIINCLGTINVAIDNQQSFLHNHSLYCAVLWKDLKGIENKSISASVKRYSRLSRKEMEAYSWRIDLRYLLGILNSKYASVLLSNLRGGDYHIYPEHLRNLPIPLVDKNRQNPIISLVDKIITAKNKTPMADTLEFERQIDTLVYNLYDITDAEIAMIEKN